MHSLHLRATFFLLSLIFCIFLALRPIPSIYSDNDTGRYVSDFHDYCHAALESTEQESKDLSYKVFYSVFSPLCVAGSDQLFLFFVAMLLPLSFLFFLEWSPFTFSIAVITVISTYGLELATNAFRQDLSMVLFFYALSKLRAKPRVAYVIGAVSAIAHISALLFFPFLIFVQYDTIKFFKKPKRLKLAIGLLAIAFLIVARYLKSMLETDFFEFYTAIYSDASGAPFVAFMTLPLYIIFASRFFIQRNEISNLEISSVAYSTLAILISLIFFPAIEYRLALFSVPLQMFLVAEARNCSRSVCAAVVSFLVVHVAIMLTLSSNYSYIWAHL